MVGQDKSITNDKPSSLGQIKVTNRISFTSKIANLTDIKINYQIKVPTKRYKKLLRI